MRPESEANQGSVFLTAPPDISRRVLDDLRRQHPTTAWVVYYRFTDRYSLGATLDGVEAVNDKPSGSKWAFLRAIRARRADVAVVVWSGHHHYDRMKVVALLSGARRFLVYDENGDSFFLEGRGLFWVRHARWRPSWGNPDVPVAVGLVSLVYKWTAGLVFGVCWSLARLFWRRARRIAGTSG